MFLAFKRVGTESCLIHKEVSQLLSVFQRVPRVVYLIIHIRIDVELHLVNAVGKAKHWVFDALYHGHEFVIDRGILLVEGGYGDHVPAEGQFIEEVLVQYVLFQLVK